MADRANVAAIAAGVLEGDRGSIAAALNLVEDRRPLARADVAALMGSLSAHTARAQRVGVTGPPGVGKSTLVAALSRALRRGTATSPPRTLGVLAVDPTSVRSGGALLGDRARIAPDPDDHGLFVRSLATQGEMGGLAPSVPLGALILSAAFDVMIVETVGVGQTETDVRFVVDTLVFVVQPGSGDSLQFMKAGVMEVPDVLVVNKCDQVDLARMAALELRSALTSLRAAGMAPERTPLLSTCALDGAGVEALVGAIDAHRAAITASGQLERHRRDGTLAWAMRLFARRFGEVGVEKVGGEDALRGALALALDQGRAVLDAVEALGTGAGP